MDLVLLGLPGAGKGTQGKKISKEFDIPHIATGNIFRQAIKEESPLGKKAKKYIDSGELVPDDVTIGIVMERLQYDDCSDGFVLDGFPRTVAQAESLSDILNKKGCQIDLALYIKVEREELIKRLSGRRICQNCGATYHVDCNPPEKEGVCDKCGGKLIQRSDDKEETVRNRLQINEKKIQNLIYYYNQKDNIEVIDGNGKIDEVFARIKEVIEERL